ncbi:Flp family type IVb pilin [Pseudomonas sp. UFMG81]|jgi:pilus assembly protein Flp/PilA|uniref:Flp family type IVb pilin n=1 Tax=Pseudomonas sp. UFMG81 TaxID=2745936 RepID=UPI00188EEF05|nr:Flp family type IVb pilin [Pseudomonas sp. UFMG81]
MLLQKIFVHCITFLQRKDGASGIEYAVIAAMVAVVMAGFVTPIGDEVKSIMQSIQTAITQ